MNNMSQGHQEQPRELVDCPDCDGTGNPLHYEDVVCSTCDGHGKIESEAPGNLI